MPLLLSATAFFNAFSVTAMRMQIVSVQSSSHMTVKNFTFKGIKVKNSTIDDIYDIGVSSTMPEASHHGQRPFAVRQLSEAEMIVSPAVAASALQVVPFPETAPSQSEKYAYQYAQRLISRLDLNWTLFDIKLYAEQFPQVVEEDRNNQRFEVIHQIMELHYGSGYDKRDTPGQRYADNFASVTLKTLPVTMPAASKSLLESLLKRVILMRLQREGPETISNKLINRFDVVLVPAYADIDATFTRTTNSSREFVVLHAAAINIGEQREEKVGKVADDFSEYSSGGRLNEDKYIKDMRLILSMVFHAAALQQVKDLVLFPFGMGAFHRHLWTYDDKYKKAEHLHELKCKLTEMMYRLMAKFQRNGKFKDLERIHICLGLNELANELGDPTSVHFPERSVNHDAFMFSAVQMATQSVPGWHEIQSMLQFHIHKDAFDLAQEIRNKGIRVMLLNGANSKLLGNHWFRPGAKQAIDENLHRRSKTLALASLYLNAGTNVRDRGSDELRQRVKKEFGGTVFVMKVTRGS